MGNIALAARERIYAPTWGDKMTYMMFKELRVLAHLIRKGYVYTVRHYPAKPPLVRDVVDGEHNFYGLHVGIMTVQRLPKTKKIRERTLKAHLHGSGFSNLGVWLDVIEELHKAHKTLWLLEAHIVGG